MRGTSLLSLAGVVCLLLFSELSAKGAEMTSGPGPDAQPTASSSVPRLIQFSGVVRDRHGEPIGGVATRLTFSVYEEPQGGAALWMESQVVELDEQGRYTVQLGATSPDGLPLELFPSGQSRWLGVQVESRDEEPRVLLVSVPYALKAADAQTLSGLPASAFALVKESSGTEEGGAVAVVGASVGQVASEAQALTQPRTSPAVISGTANFLAKFINTTDLGDSVVYESPGGNVGIGSNDPISRLSLGWGSPNVNQRIALYERTDLGGAAFRGVGMANPSGGVYGVGIWALPGASDFPSDSNLALFVRDGGNVGIGTTTPAATLDVAGNISASGSITASSFVGSLAGTATDLNCSGCVSASEVAADVATQTELDAEAVTRTNADATLQTNIDSEASTRGTRDTALSVRGINYLAGCDTCSVLADTDDQPTIYRNVIGAMTITEVWCESDAGTPSINLQRDDGIPANILTPDLACSTSGATSTSFSGSENALNVNDKLDFVMVTAGGVAKRVTVVIKATVD